MLKNFVEIFRIQFKFVQRRTRKTPNMATFHAVKVKSMFLAYQTISNLLLHYTAIDVLVWSREGFKTLPRNVTGTGRCGCAHLTNFALLLDEDQSETTKQLL